MSSPLVELKGWTSSVMFVLDYHPPSTVNINVKAREKGRRKVSNMLLFFFSLCSGQVPLPSITLSIDSIHSPPRIYSTRLLSLLLPPPYPLAMFQHVHFFPLHGLFINFALFL